MGFVERVLVVRLYVLYMPVYSIPPGVMNNQAPQKGAGSSKDVEQRVQECVQIRKQLTAVGAMISPANRERTRDAMNAFVTNGLPTQFALPIEKGNVAAVHLSIHKKSGIVLQR